MGTSAFEPVALADVRSVRAKIDVAGICGDVLSVGDVIRYDPQADQYIRARANTEANSNFVGVIESISNTDIILVYSGEIDLPEAVFSAAGSGYNTAQVFYLSDTQPGKLTYIPPSAPGSVIKPVLMVNSEITGAQVDGIVVNTTGSLIKGDSTVDLSDIQPVGSVLAFAGYTADIPAGWDICDGGYLDIATYSDLYDSLNDGKIYGFVQSVPVLLKAAGSGTITQPQIAGTKFYFIPTGGNGGAFECTILSGTLSGATAIVNAEIFVNPVYATGVSAGSYHGQEISNNGSQFQLTNASGSLLDLYYQVTSTQNPKIKLKKPDLRSRFIIGDSRSITGAENTTFASTYFIGKNGGEERHILTSSEMPIHTHASTYTASISGNIPVNLTATPNGLHNHTLFNQINVDLDFGGTNSVVRYNTSGQNNNTPIPNDGSHTHTITGSISTAGLTPNVTGTIANTGGNGAHNNVPQHVVMIWIIKTRKDSYAKLFRLGPSGGGAIIAKNTPKRWFRSSSGAGCTVDISYGNIGVSRLGTGDYRFTHDMLQELGTADQNKYIVEVSVVKNGSGATQMFMANPYSLEGLTFGVKVYDVMGSTFSDDFQYLNFTIYGGGTAL